jgi:hypothetical protein
LRCACIKKKEFVVILELRPQRHGMAFFLNAYRRVSKIAPLSVAFTTCFIKGSASDSISQKVIENKDMTWRRNFGFAMFSGLYCGVFQHFVYNIWFVRLFGLGTNFATVVKKVLADGIVHSEWIPDHRYFLWFFYHAKLTHYTSHKKCSTNDLLPNLLHVRELVLGWFSFARTDALQARLAQYLQGLLDHVVGTSCVSDFLE